VSPGGTPGRAGPPFAATDLEIRDLGSGQKPTEFDCEDDALRDFLLTEEASEYQRERLGYTYLLYLRGTDTLIAYFTISSEGLRLDKLRKFFESLPPIKIIPGVKIGRLAVARSFRDRDVGTHIIGWVRAAVEDMSPAARIVFVDSYRDSRGFYSKLGFDEIAKQGRTFLMVLNLRALPGGHDPAPTPSPPEPPPTT
jgi:predicted GNAT family N-acyltransferase